MNEEVTELQNLNAVKIIFGNNYDDFINTVSQKQEEIDEISTLPICNYRNRLINDCDEELLNYVYKNIKYYFDINKMYTPKISEGMAALVSKGIVMYSNNIANLRSYFARGNYSVYRELANPFEEISRLLLTAIVNEDVQIKGNTQTQVTLQKIENEDKFALESLKLAVTKNGVCSKFSIYGNLDIYNSICYDLEMSMIDSEHIKNATTKDSRGVILTQLDRIIDIYYTKLDFEQMITGYPTQSMSNKLKTQFENKTIFAKRNIGVYEKTKQLTKDRNN